VRHGGRGVRGGWPPPLLARGCVCVECQPSKAPPLIPNPCTVPAASGQPRGRSWCPFPCLMHLPKCCQIPRPRPPFPTTRPPPSYAAASGRPRGHGVLPHHRRRGRRALHRVDHHPLDAALQPGAVRERGAGVRQGACSAAPAPGPLLLSCAPRRACRQAAARGM